mgnify:CR=1 FL=1
MPSNLSKILDDSQDILSKRGYTALEDHPFEREEVEGVWIPTEEDIAYQDSMFCIIEQTQQDVDTIKKEFDAKKVKKAEPAVKAEKLEKTVAVKAEKKVKAEKPAKAKAPKAKKSAE